MHFLIFQIFLKPSSVAKKTQTIFQEKFVWPSAMWPPVQSWQESARAALIKYYTDQLNDTFWSPNRHSLTEHRVHKTQQKQQTPHLAEGKECEENKK